MAGTHRKGASALVGAAAALAALATAASAQDIVRRPAAAPAAHPRAVAPGARARVAAARPLTIRRRPVAAGAVDVVGAPGFYGDDYLVRQHSWNDPRLYYFGPFRTGGEVMYGDQAGNPITRGNAGLGQIAGYGPARGGFGGPHFDAVGGFHDGPGPDFKIDSDYASGSLSRPDYGDIVPRYPSVRERVARLDEGVAGRGDTTTPLQERGGGPRLSAAGRSTTLASFEEAKRQFAAPMRREAPVEAGFSNGGLGTAGLQIGDGEF